MAGLGSFIEGFVGGVDVRHNWDDRKRQRKLDDEDRTYTLEERQRKRRAEDQDQAEKDRLLKEAADDRAAAADAWKTSQDSSGTTAGPDTKAKGEGALPTSRSLTTALPDYGVGNGPGLTYAGMPSVGAGGQTPIAPTATTPTLGPDGGMVSGSQPMDLSGMMGRGQPTPPGMVGRISPPSADFPNSGGRMTPEFASMPLAGPAGGPAPRMALPGMTGRSLVYATPEGMMGRAGGNPQVVQAGPTAEEWNAMSASQRDAYTPTMGAPHFSPAPVDMLASNAQDHRGVDPSQVSPRPQVISPIAPFSHEPLHGAAGGPIPQVMPNNGEAQAGFANASAIPAQEQAALAASGPKPRSLGPSPTAAPPASVLPTPNATPAQAVAASNPAAMATNPAASPAVEVAAATAPKLRFAFGIDTPLKTSPQQAAAATNDFMQNYLDKGVPKMVDYYMKTGRPDLAVQFQSWADDKQNQKSMKLWAEGVHAAATGDEAKMLDAFSGYHNTFNKDEQVVRAKSGIIRDESGNMTGVKLTFKDTRTGKERVQEMQGSEGLLQEGIYALSPEKMFEAMQSQQSAALGAQANTIKYQQQMAIALVRYSAQRGIKTTPQRVASIMGNLQRTVMGFASKTQEEQMAMVVDQINAENQATMAIDGQSDPSAGDLPADYSDPTAQPAH